MLTTLIDSDYTHVEKVAVPAGLTNHIKWYDLGEVDAVIDDIVRDDARRQVADLVDPGDVGFVILHQCAGEVYLLLVCRWRNNNEIWETVYVKKADAEFVVVHTDDPTRATFCVWELGIVNAERLAWADFLRTSREPGEFEKYLTTTFSGTV